MSLGCAVLAEVKKYHPGLEGYVINVGSIKPIALKKAIHFSPRTESYVY